MASAWRESTRTQDGANEADSAVRAGHRFLKLGQRLGVLFLQVEKIRVISRDVAHLRPRRLRRLGKRRVISAAMRHGGSTLKDKKKGAVAGVRAPETTKSNHLSSEFAGWLDVVRAKTNSSKLAVQTETSMPKIV